MSSGILRIDSYDCGGNGDTGTGFLIGPSLVATAAHVVQDADVVELTQVSTVTAVAGRVIGLDANADVALIETDVPVTGHTFSLADRAPAVGTDIGVIGFPLGKEMQQTTGHITANDDRQQVGDTMRTGLLVTDSALNPGNSGGPWFTMDGTVVGLDDSGPVTQEPGQAAIEGNNGAIAAATARPLLDGWRSSPAPPVVDCSATTPAVDPTTRAVVATLNAYFSELELGDYSSAFAKLDPRSHPASGLARFIDGVHSSDDSGLVFGQLSEQPDGSAIVSVQFTSRQDAAHGPDGDTCDNWSLDYTMMKYRGLWLIVRTSGHAGGPTHQTC